MAVAPVRPLFFGDDMANSTQESFHERSVASHALAEINSSLAGSREFLQL